MFRFEVNWKRKGTEYIPTQRTIKGIPWISFIKFPKTRVIMEKSASEKVDPLLSHEKKGIHNAGKKVIRMPWTNAPTIHPFNPPSAFPKTPAVPPQKK